MGIDSDAEARALLQPFLDHVYYFAVYDENKFGDDHYHCVACKRTITALDLPGAEHDGFVTIHEVQYTGFPIAAQYSWVCKDCFEHYREACGWKVAAGTIPAIPEETKNAFNAAYKKYLEKLKEDPEPSE